MKLKLGQIATGYAALQRIGMEKMPIRIAYTIQRNMRLLEPDFKSREEQRIKMIETKFGKTTQDGQMEVPPAKMKAFMQEVDLLDSLEIDIDVHTINLDEIIINIAPTDLFFLDWMFVDQPKADIIKDKKHGRK